MNYDPIALPTGKLYGPVLYSCNRCFAVVYHDQRWRHDHWHQELSARPVK